ncbi:MAG: DNA primase [Ruminiclostridium sp.]|nr:DNA primase [Ruminiclostridium sp.]
MTDFAGIRQLVNIRQAAEMYGLEVNRFGSARCVFHGDNNPSMKLYDDHFHCYACGAHGDVTDLTAQMFGLSKTEAAEKLCADFGITDTPPPPAEKRKRELTVREKSLLALDILTDYIVMLRYFREHYAPFSFDTELSPEFTESLHNLEYAEYLWNEWFDSTEDERASFFTENIEQFRRYYASLSKYGFIRPSLA